MALTTLAQIKSFLNVPTTVTSQDAWLSALLLAADASIKQYCGRNFEQATYTEFYSGNGTKFLTLRQRPVTSITNIWLDHYGHYGFGDNPFTSATLLTQGKDYALDLDESGTQSRSGLVGRINTVWSDVPRQYYTGRVTAESGPSFGNIKVIYTAGYATIPQDVQYACCFVVAYMRRTIEKGAHIHGEKLDRYSYELVPPKFEQTQTPELATARQLLTRYKEFAI